MAGKVQISTNSFDKYARRWARNEDLDLDVIKTNSLANYSKSFLFKKTDMTPSVFCKHETPVIILWPLCCTLTLVSHENYIIVSAHKAANNFTSVCKSFYFKCQIEELWLHSVQGNPTCTRTNLSVSEIINKNESVLEFFGIQNNDYDFELHFLLDY